MITNKLNKKTMNIFSQAWTISLKKPQPLGELIFIFYFFATKTKRKLKKKNANWYRKFLELSYFEK